MNIKPTLWGEISAATFNNWFDGCGVSVCVWWRLVGGGGLISVGLPEQKALTVGIQFKNKK